MTTIFLELIALISTGFYFLRWVFQIHATRKAGRSVNPIMYWILTLIAGLLFTIYTILLGSIVLPLTFLFTVAISIYNIRAELKKAE